MKPTWPYVLILILLIWTDVSAQEGESHRRLSVEELLDEAESHYQVRFSYSREIVPYEDMVAVRYSTRSLKDVLQALEDQTGIIYRKRGSRVILNVDPDESPSVVQVANARNEVEEIYATDHEEPVSEESDVAHTDQMATEEHSGGKIRPNEVQSVPKIATTTFEEELKSEQAYQEDLARLENKERTRLVQVSLIPLPVLIDKKISKNYHLSLNALAGFSGSLEGLEVGILLNGMKDDVFGIQVAGLGNYVGGNVQGSQLSGLANYNDGIMRGFQMAGLANVNEQADAVQLAGMANFNRRVSRGVQTAGFFNAGRHIAGGQFAGFFNLSLGKINMQGAGFCNVAEEVDAQVSGLVNVAKQVNYFQLGLVNVADTVSGASFGLLNIIKRGYNRVEVSIGDALYANVALKLGTKHFYNVFQVSSSFRRNIDLTGPVWGYGYGFGYFRKIETGIRINPELLVMQLHERALFRDSDVQFPGNLNNRRFDYDLNLLGQLKFLFHFNKGGGAEIFAGPVFNFSVSKIYDNEKNIYGTQVAPYAIWDKTYYRDFRPINTKGWVGFSAGVRI